MRPCCADEIPEECQRGIQLTKCRPLTPICTSAKYGSPTSLAIETQHEGILTIPWMVTNLMVPSALGAISPWACQTYTLLLYLQPLLPKARSPDQLATQRLLVSLPNSAMSYPEVCAARAHPKSTRRIAQPLVSGGSGPMATCQRNGQGVSLLPCVAAPGYQAKAHTTVALRVADPKSQAVMQWRALQTCGNGRRHPISSL